MSRARTFSKMINKANYRTHRGHSSISEIEVATDSASILSSTAVTALVGIIAPFSMETTTEWRSANRWIICDGSPVSRTAYNHLFDVIGITWGVGDGSSTFNLPDLRGEFLRGFDSGQGNDPDAVSRTGGDAVGSSQEHALPALFGSWSNNHGLNRISVYNSTGLSGTTAVVGQGTSSWRQSIESSSGTYSRVDLDSTRVIPNGSDVRPRNKYVQYCIKY